MEKWTRIEYKGVLYSVRFVSAFQGELDYMVYNRKKDRDTRIRWKADKWNTFYAEDIYLVEVIKEFIRLKDIEDVEWLQHRGFEIPDILINNPQTS